MYESKEVYAANYSEWYDANPTIHNFISSVFYSLEDWISAHDIPEVWADSWLYGDSLEYIIKDGISNKYFSFDVKDAVVRLWCNKNVRDWSVCSRCHMISEGWYCEMDCCNECFCNNDEDSCVCEESIMESITSGDLEQYIYDLYGDKNSPEFILNSYDINDLVFEVMSTEGFDTYYQGVHPVISDIKSTVYDAMNRMIKADSPQDQLLAALAVTHLEHHNGVILEDYGQGVEFRVIDQINNEGLDTVIDKEDIDAFLDSGCIVPLRDFYMLQGRSVHND